MAPYSTVLLSRVTSTTSRRKRCRAAGSRARAPESPHRESSRGGSHVVRVNQQGAIRVGHPGGFDEPDNGQRAAGVEAASGLISEAASGVASVAVLRQEKVVEQTVDLQKAFALEHHPVASLSEKPQSRMR